MSGGARCSVPGCKRATYALGVCNPHYQRQRRTGSVRAEVALPEQRGWRGALAYRLRMAVNYLEGR